MSLHIHSSVLAGALMISGSVPFLPHSWAQGSNASCLSKLFEVASITSTFASLPKPVFQSERDAHFLPGPDRLWRKPISDETVHYLNSGRWVKTRDAAH